MYHVDNGFRFLSIEQFNREFRSLIYIPNERRELRVLKVDQNGRTVENTRFGLFTEPECRNQVASGVTDENGTLIFSPTGDSSTPGQAQMIWANRSNSQYYLKETAAPEGYGQNNTVIPVVVGVYGIYADRRTWKIRI